MNVLFCSFISYSCESFWCCCRFVVHEGLKEYTVRLRKLSLLHYWMWFSLKSSKFTFGVQCFHGSRKVVVSTFQCSFLLMTDGDREIFLRNHLLLGLYEFVWLRVKQILNILNSLFLGSLNRYIVQCFARSVHKQNNRMGFVVSLGKGT